MTAAIQVENLAKTYLAKQGEPVQALRGVSFEVPKGQIFGLLGPNGAGKSTLVKVLSTLTAPSGGRASVMGFDVAKDPLHVRRQLVVVLQQTAAETLLSVRDNLLIYARLHGLSMEEARQRLDHVVDEFQLREKLHTIVQELSLGTKRRIQVAKLFMLDSPVIILDEATTGMDPLMKRTVIDRLRKEVARGRTVLLTTQVLSEAEELCDTIMIINQGKTLASGSLEDLRKLSRQLFRVSLAFEQDPSACLPRLQSLRPAELNVDGRRVEMLFQGEETSLLSNLAEISRDAPIGQFEIRGPNLEEIFVELLKGSR